ncbi:MAG: PIN domain-containing protein [Chloroflexota bacterium]
MRLGPFFRVLGALVYGFIGWELGVALARTDVVTTESWQIIWPSMLVGAAIGFFLAPLIIIAPAQAARSSLRQVPITDLVTGTIGLCAGLFISALLAFPLSTLPTPFGSILPFVVVIILGYLGAAVLIVRQDDLLFMFRLKRPTTLADVEPDHRPVLLLDTSVIIDGRIADIAKTGFLLGKLTVPRFVLNELQYIADSSDALRRNRGRRGLEMLDRLQSEPAVEIDFIDQDPQDAQQVDDKLISLAMVMGAAIVTNDYNLNRVANLQGVLILNINELANAVKSVLLPGEELPIKVIQEGKEHNQGVGYLEDGTMVVIESGRRYLDQEVLVQVTKVLQTNAGRLIFASPFGD